MLLLVSDVFVPTAAKKQVFNLFSVPFEQKGSFFYLICNRIVGLHFFCAIFIVIYFLLLIIHFGRVLENICLEFLHLQSRKLNKSRIIFHSAVDLTPGTLAVYYADVSVAGFKFSCRAHLNRSKTFLQHYYFKKGSLMR